MNNNKFYKCLIKIVLINFSLFLALTGYSIEADFDKKLNEELNLKIEFFKSNLRLTDNEPIEFEKGSIYLPEGVSNEDAQKLVRVAAYDVGSTGVKFKIADVDPETNKIMSIMDITKNTEHLGFEINEGNYLDRISIMSGLKAIMEQYFTHFSDIKHVAVATAGFRKAGDKGVELAKMIMKFDGIDFKIINQDDEGLLAYYGVIAKASSFDLDKDMVWDIGGGSSQFVFNEEVGGENKLNFYGVEIGGNRFNEFVRKLVKLYGEGDVKRKVSPNPMMEDEIEDAIEVVKFLLTERHVVKEFDIKPFSLKDLKAIKDKIAQGGTVYGIGAVHNFIAKLYGDLAAGGGKRAFYTKEDIKGALRMLLGKTDDEIFAIKGGKDPKEKVFVKGDFTSLVLVYAMMDVLGIDKVYTVKASNTDGLIIKTVMEHKASEKSKVKDIL